MPPRRAASTVKRKWTDLQKLALSFPEAWEDHPWDEVVVKVRKKIFVFLGHADSDPLTITVKLTESRDHALTVVGAAPSGYGMGKSGWVTLPITDVDLDLLHDWVEESFRNIAPKTVAARLDR
jgi:predicted DNA-binding protein (MmcQ/YjbR family)